MTRSKPLAQAEKMAQEGLNESQDSQAIFDAHRAMFGVGTVRTWTPEGCAVPGCQRNGPTSGPQPSSPAAPARPTAEIDVDFPGQPRGRLPVEVDQVGARAEKKQATTDDDTARLKPFFDLPRPREPDDDGTGAVKDASPLDARLAPVLPDDKPATVLTAAGALMRKMDTSQPTPTQINHDRDYSAFCDPLPSSPVAVPPQRNTHTLDVPRTLQQGDTGAVSFGNLSDLARPSSQVSEDGGFDATRSEWRVAEGTSQLHSNPIYTPYKPRSLPPETPALPKNHNPFAAKPNISAPLAATQLFGQTQQLSSAVKASPTSSRPSPSALLDSISPIVETSPLKNRTNVSSPTEMQTSSPPRLHQVPATSLKVKSGAMVHQVSPAGSRSPRDELIPESPTDQAPKPHSGRQPLAHYEPMKQSQERKASADGRPRDPITDDDYDDALQKLERRKRAERKRAQAAEEMEKVSFARHLRRDSAEQPSRKRRRAQDVEEDIAGAAVSNRSKSREPTVVRDSQKGPAPSLETPSAESTKATPGEGGAGKDGVAVGQEVVVQKCTETEPADEEIIPATSPMQSSPRSNNPRSMRPASTEPELPALTEDDASHKVGGGDTMKTSSPPPVRRRTQRTYSTWTRQVRGKPFLSSSTSEALHVEPGDKMEKARSTLESPASTASTVHPETMSAKMAQRDDPSAKAKGVRQAHKIPPLSSRRESFAPILTRLRRNQRDPLTPPQARAGEAITIPSSSLTTLSATPAPSSETTPGTQELPASERPASLNMTSGTSKNLRKRVLRVATKSESPLPMTRAIKMARRSMRLDSDSTDELHHSPSPSAFDKGTSYAKSGRWFRHSIGSTCRGQRRLFEGMVFALSCPSDKPEKRRTNLESQIMQAGGTVLKNGFQELFEPLTNSVLDGDEALKLLRANSECGFTALIADGHSRKAKYMQALALGLPCLGQQWITACLNKGEIVDWEPYLLCAGSSAVLGNAIRSRLLPPYPAVDARLADVVAHRRRLLQGQSILAVVDGKKGRNETKQQYMFFLVQALGPSTMLRVSTAQQARAALQEGRPAGRRFDWLYIDESAGTAESILSSARGVGSKKRKHEAVGAPGWEDMGVLTDELVIQSLILGRMVEQGELDS